MKFFLSFVFKKYSSVLLKRQKNYKIDNKMGVGGGGGGWGYDKYLYHPPRGSKNNRVPPIHMTYSIKASLNYQSETILAE